MTSVLLDLRWADPGGRHPSRPRATRDHPDRRIAFTGVLVLLALTASAVWTPTSRATGLAGARTAATFPMDSGSVPAATSPASSGVAAASGSLLVTTRFPGLAFSLFTNDVAPPDPVVAAGPDHVMEIVNQAVGIWTRGGTLRSDVAAYAFFRVSSTDFLSDPKVLYDAPTGRWFASIDDLTRSSVEVATSTGPDPTGTWTTQEFRSGASCPDQPLLGLSHDVVVVSVNDFSACTMNATFLGAELFVINKTDLLAGHPAASSRLGPYLALASVYPVHALDAGAPQYLVSVGFGLTPTKTLNLFRVSGIPPGPVTLPESNLTIRTVLQPPNAPQLGTSLQVNTGDSRTLDAFLAGSSIWMTFADACTAPVTGANHSCVRLLKIDTAGPSLAQDFDSADPNLFYFYPAIRPDAQGNLLVVFGASSGSTYPGVLAATQLATDPANTLRAPVVVANGTGFEALSCPDSTSCRYGDYFGAGVDPQDPSQVWVAGEVGTSRGWGTEVAALGLFPTLNLTASYAVSGGVSGFPGVGLSYFLDGVAQTLALQTTPATVSVDLGSTWSVPATVLASGGDTRWATAQPTSGAVDAPTTIALAYSVQYRVTAWTSGSGGTVSGASGWYDPGAQVSFTATAAAGWKFLGWQGAGSASVTGTQDPVVVNVTGPANETAIFGAGVTISAGAGGSVAYAFGNASGEVAGGTSQTIYVPGGASLTLTAIPDGLNQFSGWSGAVTGGRGRTVVAVNGPMSVSAGFTSWVVILGLFVGVPLLGVVVFVAVYVLLRRRQKPVVSPPSPPGFTPQGAPVQPPERVPPG